MKKVKYGKIFIKSIATHSIYYCSAFYYSAFYLLLTPTALKTKWFDHSAWWLVTKVQCFDEIVTRTNRIKIRI